MRLIKVLMIALTLSSISCATKPSNSQNYLSENVIQNNAPIPAPDIGYNPEDASFPLRIDPADGKIKPSYQYQVCVKKFILCLKWEKRTVFFDQLDWFYQQSFELRKMERP